MRNQREPTKETGLPANACAPDLFTRIDGLKANAAPHADFPVRWYLGFGDPLPNFKKIRGDSWLWKLVQNFAGKPEDSKWWATLKDLFTGILVFIVWAAGFWADVLAASKVGPGGCKDDRLKEIKADIAAKEIIGRFMGVNVEHTVQIDVYARNYLCPTETLTGGEAIAAYLADEIDQQAVEDYNRADNRCPHATAVNVATGQQRLGAAELDTLLDRNHITREQYNAEMRKLGWLSSQYVEWLQDLSTWWPDQGTLLNWMRRKTTREAEAQRLGWDDGFADAYNDEAKKWAGNLDLTDEQAKWLWRSQFQPVDMSTAYDWYARTQAGLMSPGARFNDDDLLRAIEQSPLPPKYRQAAYEARWRPLGIRQLKSAYEEDLLTDDQVAALLIAEGIYPDQGQLLLADWRKDKPAAKRRKIGVTGASGFTGMYAEGVIGQSEYLAELAALGFTAAQQQEALQEARAERNRDHRKELIGYLKKRYLTGEIDESQVQSVLGSTGLQPVDVGELLRLWRVEFEVRPRQAGAGEMVGWYRQGLMSEAQLAAGLAQLRYSAVDAARIIGAADLVKLGQHLKTAEGLVKKADKSLKVGEAEWKKQIDRAEKLAGTPAQRIVTQAGKMLHWVEDRVVKKTKKVGEKGPPDGVFVYPDPAATAATAEFMAAGTPANVVPGDALAGIDLADLQTEESPPESIPDAYEGNGEEPPTETE